MARPKQNDVFINCPFDRDYQPIFQAIIFAVFDCGFVARSALELNDSADVRIEKIARIIGECRYGIHDISRTELDRESQLPRFNMPLELGLFLGARRFGGGRHGKKSCLIMDTERYRFQMFISDIAGQDIMAHGNQPQRAVGNVRDWLNTESGRKTIPGGNTIWRRFERYRDRLPVMTERAGLELDEMTFNDHCNFTSEWLQQTAQSP